MSSATLQISDAGEAVLASFSNGIPQADNTISADYYKHKSKTDPRMKNARMLVAQTDRLQYVGKNFGPNIPQQGLTKYMIGVLNKKTGKMKVYNSQIIKMHPYLTDSASEAEDEVDKNKDASFVERADMLTSAFGSTRKRKAMESRIRNQIKGQALEDAVRVAVDLAKVETSSPVVQKTSQASTVIPPFDKEATMPEGVYNLDDIISPGELEALSTAAKVFTDSNRETVLEWIKQEVYPKYVLEHLVVLPVRVVARVKKSCLLLYLTYMLHMYQLRARDLERNEFMIEGVPDLVKKNLLDKFTYKMQSGKSNKIVRCMPARLKDKLVSYVLVLCLYIDEFCTPLHNLQIDLKMGQDKLMIHARALGCRVRKVKSESGGSTQLGTAELTVPLTFPEITAKKKKDRR